MGTNRETVDKEFYDKSSALLSAFDQVANSNSFLLKGPPAEGTLKRRFLYFVPSRGFKRALCEADRVRDWHNFHKMDDKLAWVPKSGGFSTGGHIEFTKSLTSEQFARRLTYLLNSGPCFYGKRYPKPEVGRIVKEFLLDFPVDEEVLQVQPDFLFSHDYLNPKTDLPDKAICYFDGCGCDQCWTWLSNGDLLVLLLNGTS